MVSHLTIIRVVSVALFVRYLLGRLSAYKYQIWQGSQVRARKRARENEILKFHTVVMKIGGLAPEP